MEFDISTYDVRCIFFLGGSRQQEVVSRLLYNFCARQTAITSYSIRALHPRTHLEKKALKMQHPPSSGSDSNTQ
jgi:hypothetical protein